MPGTPPRMLSIILWNIAGADDIIDIGLLWCLGLYTSLMPRQGESAGMHELSPALSTSSLLQVVRKNLQFGGVGTYPV